MVLSFEPKARGFERKPNPQDQHEAKSHKAKPRVVGCTISKAVGYTLGKALSLRVWGCPAPTPEAANRSLGQA